MNECGTRLEQYWFWVEERQLGAFGCVYKNQRVSCTLKTHTLYCMYVHTNKQCEKNYFSKDP